MAQSSCTRTGSARSSAFRCFFLGRLSGLPLHLCDSWHFLEKRLELLWRRQERGVALDERGLGSGAVLVPVLETATATVEYVITLAARGWPAGGGRGIVYSFLEEALHVHGIAPRGRK